ncbi:hypothetical protein HMPREF0653_02791 [Prevotella disiens JCM 6334 = ATCC 29426]|uniref:Uncharacterized protein n=1 Tax=Prevotella disiens JCM 6334 = ATCC 29426 TaxID=1235811 RepID=A0ABP2Y3H7_9BACT|nr:hypothetical protein HMPREF0653_02791 [Prevotella disiens JCM 6334 = ATCC 29426]
MSIGLTKKMTEIFENPSFFPIFPDLSYLILDFCLFYYILITSLCYSYLFILKTKKYGTKQQ